jgi:hypothetical protein
VLDTELGSRESDRQVATAGFSFPSHVYRDCFPAIVLSSFSVFFRTRPIGGNCILAPAPTHSHMPLSEFGPHTDLLSYLRRYSSADPYS